MKKFIYSLHSKRIIIRSSRTHNRNLGAINPCQWILRTRLISFVSDTCYGMHFTPCPGDGVSRLGECRHTSGRPFRSNFGLPSA